MAFELPAIEHLSNESDVEAKLIMPLLTSSEPYGFGISISCIQTKANIRRFTIGKGSDQKLYFPDFLVIINGYPLVVIEAKPPGHNIHDAFREARLYAHELNAVFPSGQNPLKLVLAINGEQIAFGHWDQSAPIHLLDLRELLPSSRLFSEVQRACSKTSLEHAAVALQASNNPIKLKKPRRLVGGSSIQQEEVGHNTFGATISADFGRIFNPTTREDRSFIAQFGYIPSLRRTRYVDPIDRVIRASRPHSEVDAKPIENSGKPQEVIDALKKFKALEHQVLLIVGSVGSGKTTFIDYLEEVALPRDLVAQTVWVRLNMNGAPISEKEIYDWLRKQIISGCRDAYPSTDFDNLASLRLLYSVEINRFNKGRGQLYQFSTEKYNEELAKLLEDLEKDLHQTAVAYSRHCATEREKLLIIVLDNCDKRLLTEQLLMFQAAEWIQKEFRALVILPLREETYDNHRDRPPLDTAMKDLVFRIEPPLFQNVLVSRVQLALNELTKASEKTYRYELPNGFHVEYASTDQAFYLTSILSSIFEHDRHIRRMITGLAGRNLRRALEIFLEFCTSGHIGEDQIFKIRQSEGRHTLPIFLVTQVLLRLNRRFYDSDHSYIKNLFDANRLDPHPVFFARLGILRWLYEKFTTPGPTGLRGYFQIKQIKSELVPLGFDEYIVDREIEYLAKAFCILSEDFRTESLSDGDLVRLAPAGFVHLELVGNPTYLAATAEDTSFDNEVVAQQIAKRISHLREQYEVSTVLSNASDLIQYLNRVRKSQLECIGSYLERSDYESLTNISDADNSVKRLQDNCISGPWIDISEKLQPGLEVTGIVVNTKDYGVFVELKEFGVTGLIHKSKLPHRFETNPIFAPGEDTRVKVIDIDPIRQRLGLSYIADALPLEGF